MISRQSTKIIVVIIWVTLFVAYQQCGPSNTLDEGTRATRTSSSSNSPSNPVNAPPSNCNGIPEFNRDVRNFVQAYCISCHRSGNELAGLNFEPLLDEAQASTTAAQLLSRARTQASLRLMPPAGSGQPNSCEISRFQNWQPSGQGQTCTAQSNPGKVVIARLTRNEYVNTVYDLTSFNGQPGIDLKPTTIFGRIPSDPGALGFDNVSSVQSMNADKMTSYFEVAGFVADQIYANAAIKAAIVPCSSGVDCLRQIFSTLMRKAYRRSVTSAYVNDQVTRIRNVVTQNSGTFDDMVKLGIQATLTSPYFLYKVINDRVPNTLGGYQLNGFEVATRLSYFLWQTAPDEQLLLAAENGSLLTPNGLEAQINRMLASPRAKTTFVNTFVNQWLRLGQFQDMVTSGHFNTTYFPQFNTSIGNAMVTESNMFVNQIFTEDRSPLEFLTAEYSYLNPQLAQYYGLPAITGTGFRKVSLAGTTRQGILTQGSVLAQTSKTYERSIIHRGVFLLANILCSHPGSPPEVQGDTTPPPPGTTLRQKISAHSTNVSCAACHKSIDPMGFAFENFSGVAQWQTMDNGHVIDATGTLPTGQSFNGARGLVQVLSSTGIYNQCVTKMMMTYATGRGLASYDQCTVNRISRDYVTNQSRLSDFMKSIIKSDVFLKSAGGN